MDCQTTRSYRDDFLDGRLDEAARQAVASHLRHCPDCAQRFREDEALMRALRDLPVPPAATDLLEGGLARAQERKRRNRRLVNFGGLAVAASLVLAVAVGLLAPGSAPEGPTVVAVTPGQTERVNLVFNSPSRLEGVTLSVAVPDGVEIAGYPGKRKLTWQTTLESGRNLLRLPVILRGAGGVLRADVQIDDTRRSFDLQLRPRDPDRSGLTPEPAA